MATPSGLSIGLLVGITLLLAAGIAWAVLTGARRAGFGAGAARVTLVTVVGLALWLVVTGIVAGQGLLLNFGALPPPLFRVFLPGIALTALMAFTAPGRALS